MGRTSEVVRRYQFTSGNELRLAAIDPADTGRITSKEKARAALARGIERLSALQEKLYAQDRWAVLLVFQAMDAAGKDGTIKHVMSGVNPQGCEVHSFKSPSVEELNHDFLWRCAVRLPERGRIGIFNRSYYEEVLVVRVHTEFLAAQRLPSRLVSPEIWAERFDDIVTFERHLARNGTLILKFFLHVSRDEQRRRFLERLDTPDKNWKFSPADVAERRHWDAYMAAYGEMLRATAKPEAPWYVVPSDHKWFARYVVAEAVIGALEGLDLTYPTVDAARRKELRRVRADLMAEADSTAD
ncbi:MAG TPA: polyphosphate kinase 2 family protein [Thermoanaerobaculaceae bacterium]|nr:polyphosphate kinase 2 family protein [Thermoanaerobaculaceae bacterium]